MNALEKLRHVVDELKRVDDPLGPDGPWQLAGRLLARMPVDQKAVAEAIKKRDTDALDALIASVEDAAKPKAPAAQPTDEAVEITDDMRAALRAFKKRLKLARLNDESKLGGRQLSGGKHSEIDAIQPPAEFSYEIWQALIQAGKLRDTGQGFYALT